MSGLAPFTVSALGAVHTGFDRQEDTAVDGLLDFPGEEDKAVEVVLVPERVELMMCRRFRLREDIEPEQGIHAVLLPVSVGEHGRLKIPFRFSVRPFRRGGFPVGDCFVSTVNDHQIELADERLLQPRHFDAE